MVGDPADQVVETAGTLTDPADKSLGTADAVWSPNCATVNVDGPDKAGGSGTDESSDTDLNAMGKSEDADEDVAVTVPATPEVETAIAGGTPTY